MFVLIDLLPSTPFPGQQWSQRGHWKQHEGIVLSKLENRGGKKKNKTPKYVWLNRKATSRPEQSAIHIAQPGSIKSKQSVGWNVVI